MGKWLSYGFYVNRKKIELKSLSEISEKLFHIFNKVVMNINSFPKNKIEQLKINEDIFPYIQDINYFI